MSRPGPRGALPWVLGATFAVALPALLVELMRWPDVAHLARENPTTTAFIERSRAQFGAAGVDWRWVPENRISVHLKRAVVAAEDMEFFSHRGFSATELRVALRDAVSGRRKLRGASTITQQLAKNLWLSPSRNPWRKIKEALLSRALEKHLSKRRILEIYLNVVELGPGIHGVEAAAQRYFARSAATLTEHEAAQLAAVLPRPASWHPGADAEGYARYVATIRRRMSRAGFLWRHVDGPVPVEAAPLGAEAPPPPITRTPALRAPGPGAPPRP